MKHIEEIIMRYLNEKVSNSAIMISGEWGSGKTYYWKNVLLPEVKKDKKVLYVSLNGITSLDELTNVIIIEKIKAFTNAPNFVFGKFAYNAYKLSETILKSKTGIELPKFEFKGMLDFSKSIICFDDLERLGKGLEMQEVLGYINSTFVEHNGVKVIIIGNEKEIIEEAKTSYWKYKEKLIS